VNGVFVAYPFEDRTQAIVDGTIQPALLSQGFECMTARSYVGHGAVDGVRCSIENSVGVIGIALGRNPNVFFELGVASGLRKPCILLVESNADAAMLHGAYPAISLQSSNSSLFNALAAHIRRWRRPSVSNIDLMHGHFA
jgi:hypothetical protein